MALIPSGPRVHQGGLALFRRPQDDFPALLPLDQQGGAAHLASGGRVYLEPAVEGGEVQLGGGLPQRPVVQRPGVLQATLGHQAGGVGLGHGVIDGALTLFGQRLQDLLGRWAVVVGIIASGFPLAGADEAVDIVSQGIEELLDGSGDYGLAARRAPARQGTGRTRTLLIRPTATSTSGPASLISSTMPLKSSREAGYSRR